MDLEICIRHKGKTYCWDSEDESIKEIIMKPVNISDCPEIVVFDMMRRLGRVYKENHKEEGENA